MPGPTRSSRAQRRGQPRAERGDDPGGRRFASLPGPPWILGWRGSPTEAPENTLPALVRACELGLDGVAYDLRACRSGELVLHADATLERTTDAHGALAETSLPELATVDAGAWFHARFRGERLALFDEVLERFREQAAAEPPLRQVAELHEGDALERAVELVRASPARHSLALASTSRAVCLAARDAGLVVELVVPGLDDELLRFVRDERLGAVRAPLAAWLGPAGRLDWPCERRAGPLSAPDDLLAACRAPLAAFTTSEPLRALAARTLARMPGFDGGGWPVHAPTLAVEPDAFGEAGALGGRPVAGQAASLGAQWAGRWERALRVRNPFAFDVRVTCGVIVRRGAFEVDGVPLARRLAPGEELVVPFRLTGGSWSPGGDPCAFALYRWRRGPGRDAGGLLVDAPLERVRTVAADALAQRLSMLRERPGDRPASMTLRRHRGELLLSLEDPGGLSEARALAMLEGRHFRGGRGLRLRLPAAFDRSSAGLAFSCGFEGLAADPGGGTRRVVRRWAGGLAGELVDGAPGRLVPLVSG